MCKIICYTAALPLSADRFPPSSGRQSRTRGILFFRPGAFPQGGRRSRFQDVISSEARARLPSLQDDRPTTKQAPFSIFIVTCPGIRDIMSSAFLTDFPQGRQITGTGRFSALQVFPRVCARSCRPGVSACPRPGRRALPPFQEGNALPGAAPGTSVSPFSHMTRRSHLDLF